MTDLLIRQYQAEDKAVVWQLHELALDAVGTNLGPGPWNDDLEQIETVYLNGRGEFLLGEVDGRVVAMGAFRETSGALAEIKRMRVHPDWQRRGFGQQLLTELERRARELGYQRLHLDTTVQQIGAQCLYEKNGYQEVRRGKIGPLDCMFYEKEI